MAKIQLELGGKYSAAQAFKQAQEDSKKLGRDMKDVGSIGVKSFNEIAKHADGNLKNSLNGVSGVLSGFLSGGIFGAVAGAAQWAFGAISDAIKEAKQRAKELYEGLSVSMVAGMEKLKEASKGLKEDISSTTREMQEMISIAKGEISNDVKFRVAEINVQTLQKMTDEMSDAEKKVVQAEGAYEAAMVKAYGVVNTAVDAQNKINGRIRDLQSQREQAEANLTEAKQMQEKLEAKYGTVIRRYTQAQELAARSVEDWIEQGETRERAEEKVKRWNDILAMHKEKHATIMENYNKVTAGVAELEGVLKSTNEEEVSLKRKLRAEIDNESVARKELTLAEAESKKALEEARGAVKKETEQRIAANEKEQKRLDEQEEREERKREADKGMLDVIALCYENKMEEARYTKLYTQFIAQNMSREEAIQNILDVYKENKEAEARITKVCQANKVKEAEYIKKYYEMIDKGLTEEQAFTQLQRDLNDQLKERTKAEKEATEATKDAKKNQDKKDKSEANAFANISVDISNPEDMKDTDTLNKFKDAEKENARKTRDKIGQMHVDADEAQKFLKGHKTKEEMDQFKRYLVEQEQKWSKQDAEEAQKQLKLNYLPSYTQALMAMGSKGELLSPKSKEWQKQSDFVKNLNKDIQETVSEKTQMGKHMKETAESTKETAKSVKNLGAK